jgi:predicted RNase H-like nuclease (RuvC/YqgF family)
VANLELEICCNDCGEALDSNVNSKRGVAFVEVEFCPKCSAKLNDEITEKSEEIEDLAKEIETLKEHIEALQIELTYVKLKKNEPIQ